MTRRLRTDRMRRHLTPPPPRPTCYLMGRPVTSRADVAAVMAVVGGPYPAGLVDDVWHDVQRHAHEAVRPPPDREPYRDVITGQVRTPAPGDVIKYGPPVRPGLT